MISLPISVLSTKIENFIPLSTIKEHQQFCKNFLNSYHSFKKKKTGDKEKNKSRRNYEMVFEFNRRRKDKNLYYKK